MYKPDKPAFDAAIRRMIGDMLKQGFKKWAIAQKLGIEASMVTRLMKNERGLSLETQFRIAEHLEKEHQKICDYLS